MAAQQPLTIILSLLLSGVPLQASARVSPTAIDLNADNYQPVAANFSNQYKVLLAPETYLITRQENDKGRQKDMTPEPVSYTNLTLPTMRKV